MRTALISKINLMSDSLEIGKISVFCSYLRAQILFWIICIDYKWFWPLGKWSIPSFYILHWAKWEFRPTGSTGGWGLPNPGNGGQVVTEMQTFHYIENSRSEMCWWLWGSHHHTEVIFCDLYCHDILKDLASVTFWYHVGPDRGQVKK